MMPQDGDLRYEESFNSFLAGVLLTRRKINYFEFLNLMDRFEKIYNVSVVSFGGDICVPIYFDDHEINLYKDIDEIINVGSKNMTIRYYLYSFTTSRVRNFFGIPDMKVEEKRINSFIKKLFKKNSTVKRKAII